MPLAVGDIVYVYVPSLQNPKKKYAVVASLEPRALLLLISTDKTAFKQLRPELDAAQLVVDCGQHPCLKYDSWLDCTEPHCLDSLVAECAADPSIVVGSISPGLRQQIIATVSVSRTLPKRTIRWMLEALAPRS